MHCDCLCHSVQTDCTLIIIHRLLVLMMALPVVLLLTRGQRRLAVTTRQLEVAVAGVVRGIRRMVASFVNVGTASFSDTCRSVSSLFLFSF